jgi:alkylation response protein AidB-like acyl-CoA dehydrogenase
VERAYGANRRAGSEVGRSLSRAPLPGPSAESIPTSSLQLGGTGWIQHHSIPNRPRSAHWKRPAGPPEPSTQIYEGTNQIQRVVIAKALLG